MVAKGRSRGNPPTPKGMPVSKPDKMTKETGKVTHSAKSATAKDEAPTGKPMPQFPLSFGEARHPGGKPRSPTVSKEMAKKPYKPVFAGNAKAKNAGKKEGHKGS